MKSPEAQHDRVAVEQVVAVGAVVVTPPSAYTNAIDSARVGARRQARAARAIAADAAVRRRLFSAQADESVMRSGQQVDDGVRPVERAAQRRRVGLDGARPEAREPFVSAAR